MKNLHRRPNDPINVDRSDIKVNPMPDRRSPAAPPNAATPPRASFRRRYDELEARRETLMARLRALDKISERHPGYKQALTLLNQRFRRAKLAQRLAILEAATWLIDILERVTTIV